jgi:hypothetical protein
MENKPEKEHFFGGLEDAGNDMRKLRLKRRLTICSKGGQVSYRTVKSMNK